MDYNIYINRLSSFKNYNWISSTQCICKEEIFAKAGFYSIGYKDYVKCFKCNGGLCKWQQNDDPWVEHAKYYPLCEFVIENKSELFIKICGEMLEIESENRKLIANFDLLCSRVKEHKKHHFNDKFLCKICYENEMDSVLLPCAHQLSCFSCTQRFNKCPVCNKEILIKKKIYIC